MKIYNQKKFIKMTILFITIQLLQLWTKKLSSLSKKKKKVLLTLQEWTLLKDSHTNTRVNFLIIIKKCINFLIIIKKLKKYTPVVLWHG